MRRLRYLPLVAAFAAPGLVLADVATAGQVVHSNEEKDQYFNRAECEVPASGPPATMELSYQLSPSIGSSGVIKWFAQDRQPTARSGETLVRCYEEDTTEGNTTTYVVGLNPPGDVPAGINETAGTEDIQLSLFATNDNLLTCDTPSDTVYVCVHFYPYASGTQTPVDVPTAAAWGKVLLDTRTPPTPAGLSLEIGDTRLYARWRAGTGGAAVGDYLVKATRIDGTGDPREKTVATTKATIDGLENDVEYTVEVVSRSISGTESEASVSANAIPRHVKDFWEVYEDQGGQEQGGCGGPAGPLALLGLAGVAALVRLGRRP